jgi:hypothetical protein
VQGCIIKYTSSDSSVRIWDSHDLLQDSSSDSGAMLGLAVRLVAQFKMLHPVTVYQLIIIIDLELNKVLLHSYLVLCNFEKRDGQ